MLEAAETRGRRHGCVDVELSAARHRGGAHAFYRSLGYEDLCAGLARFRRSLGRARD